jgi:short-subunit dehydrogenase
MDEDSNRSGARLAIQSSRLLPRLVSVFAGARNVSNAIWRRLTRRFRNHPHDLRILITGATTGIGLATARALAREGHHRLILTGRASSLERLTEFAELAESDRLCVFPLDVVSTSQRHRVVAAAEARFGGIDVLVNNAGISYRSVVEHVTEDERLAQLEINYLAPMALTRLVLPGMRARRYGKVINISSVGGMTAMPTMATYSASKFALEGASEALWYELKPWGVSVTLVRPGFVHSDGFQKVRFTEQGAQSLSNPSDPYHRHYVNMSAFVEALMQLTFYGPEDVAETICDVIAQKTPPLRVAGTFDARVFDLMRRALPSALYHRLLYAALPRIWEWGDHHPENERV